MLDDTPINALAREIAKETGQPKRSAERRLRALKNSRRFKILAAAHKSGGCRNIAEFCTLPRSYFCC